MFSTGGSTLIVEKIQPVETRACEGIVEWLEKDMRQVVHILDGAALQPRLELNARRGTRCAPLH